MDATKGGEEKLTNLFQQNAKICLGGCQQLPWSKSTKSQILSDTATMSWEVDQPLLQCLPLATYCKSGQQKGAKKWIAAKRQLKGSYLVEHAAWAIASCLDCRHHASHWLGLSVLVELLEDTSEYLLHACLQSLLPAASFHVLRQ